jgi:hypothetical protein
MIVFNWTWEIHGCKRLGLSATEDWKGVNVKRLEQLSRLSPSSWLMRISTAVSSATSFQDELAASCIFGNSMVRTVQLLLKLWYASKVAALTAPSASIFKSGGDLGKGSVTLLRELTLGWAFESMCQFGSIGWQMCWKPGIAWTETWGKFERRSERERDIHWEYVEGTCIKLGCDICVRLCSAARVPICNSPLNYARSVVRLRGGARASPS